MNLQQLYYFQAIYQHKNYTKASEQLYIAQSSLSHSISDLEKELGIPLFYKRGRSIVASEYADRFYIHVNNIIRELKLAHEEIQEWLDPQTGTIHIGMSHTLSMDFMPGMIRKFCEQPGNANIRFEWEELTASYVNEALCEGKIDLGFGAKIENRLLEYQYISADEVSLIVPPGHPLSKKKVAAFSELSGEHLVTFPYTCGTRYYIDGLLKDYGVHPASIVEVATEKLMAGLVAAGRGIAILPVIPEMVMYDVVRVDLEGEKLSRPMYMVWVRDGFMKPVVRHFRDFVVSEVSEPCG